MTNEVTGGVRNSSEITPAPLTLGPVLDALEVGFSTATVHHNAVTHWVHSVTDLDLSFTHSEGAMFDQHVRTGMPYRAELKLAVATDVVNAAFKLGDVCGLPLCP